jgi:hypothetical protein
MKNLLIKGAGTRSKITRLGVGLLASTLLSSSLANAQTAPSTDGRTSVYADLGSISSPVGGVWVGDTTTLGQLWVSDNIHGLCRLDASGVAGQFKLTANTDNAISATPNAATGAACFPVANASANVVGQPDIMITSAGKTGVVYLPITTGAVAIHALTVDLKTQVITKDVVLADATVLQKGAAPVAVALGALNATTKTRSLYIADQKGGVFTSITLKTDGTAASINAATGFANINAVGVNDRGGSFITGMAYHNGHLYSAAGSFLFRVSFVDSCNGGCVSENLNVASQAVGADHTTSANAKYLYFDDFGILVNQEKLLQYDGSIGTLATESRGIESNPVGSLPAVPFASIFGIVVDPQSNVYLIDDTSGGLLPDAARPVVPNVARVFKANIKAGVFSGSSGTTAPIPVPVLVKGSVSATSFSTSFGKSNGAVWIPGGASGAGHLWISDATRGLCQVNGNGSCFKPAGVTNFVAGQASYGITYDALGNATVNLYVPDAGASSSAKGGVYRVLFNSLNETLGASTRIATLAGVPAAVAVGLEGSVYVGYSNLATIDKITTPDTTPTVVTRLAQTFGGTGVKGMTFIGNDLYLVESTQITVILKAAPALTRGAAQPVGGILSRTQTPPLIVDTPLSISSDGVSVLFIASGKGEVDQYDLSTSKQTLLANSGNNGKVAGFGPVSSIAVDTTAYPTIHVYAADDGTGANEGSKPTIWKVE